MIRWVNVLLPRLSFSIWVSLESRYGMWVVTLSGGLSLNIDDRRVFGLFIPFNAFLSVCILLLIGVLLADFCWRCLLSLVAYVRSAATTLPRAERDLLINFASYKRSVFFSVSAMRSLPAKSINENLEISFWSWSWAYLSRYCGSKWVFASYFL